MPRLIYLIRHAPIQANGLSLIVGQMDLPAIIPDQPLQQDFPWQSDAVWIISPAQRAKQTAAYLEAIAPQHDPRLLEQAYGDWEGRTWNELLKSDANAQAYLDAYHLMRPPGGESLGDVRSRCVRALKHWRASTNQDLILVCHAGPIRCLIAHTLGLPTQLCTRIDIEPLSVSTLKDWDGQALTLVSSNQPLR
jgi:broad specificity phosphatase PhoE